MANPMDTAATSIADRPVPEAYPASGSVTPELAARRIRQRRHMLLAQVVSYSLVLFLTFSFGALRMTARQAMMTEALAPLRRARKRP